METNANHYNQTNTYDNELKPHIDEIKKICAINKIPCFICVAAANTEKGTTYKYDGILPGYLQLQLMDDKFAKHLCVANGFDVRPIGVVNDFKDVTDFLAETQLEELDGYTEPLEEDD